MTDLFLEALKAALAVDGKEIEKWEPVPVKTAPIEN